MFDPIRLFLRMAAVLSQDFQDAEQICTVRVLLDQVWVAEIDEFPSRSFVQYLGNHIGMLLLLGSNLTPHRAIWTLATISAVFGADAALYFFAGASAPDDKTIATLPHNIWYAAGMSSNAYLSALPNGLALVTLISNFGTFINLRPDQSMLHLRLPRAARIPRTQTYGDTGVWRPRQRSQYGVLHNRTDRGTRQHQGTTNGGRHRDPVGLIRSVLLHTQFQEEGQEHDPGGEACMIG